VEPEVASPIIACPSPSTNTVTSAFCERPLTARGALVLSVGDEDSSYTLRLAT